METKCAGIKSERWQPGGRQADAARVFQLVGRGLNSREIAERLQLELTTVDSYRARIKEKLGIRNAAELYQRAAQWVAGSGL